MTNAIPGVVGKHMGFDGQSNAAAPPACSNSTRTYRVAVLSHLTMCSCMVGAEEILECGFEHVDFVFFRFPAL